MRRACNDLLTRKERGLEIMRHRNRVQFTAYGRIPCTVLFVPLAQLVVGARQLQRGPHSRFVGGFAAGPATQQNFLGLAAGHERLLLSRRRTTCWSWAMPRAIRDLTVPSGISSTSAI